MTTSTAEMAKNTGLETGRTSYQNDVARPLSSENAASAGNLDGCYRQIGISAVAAAVRYQGAAKNPAYAPARSHCWDAGDEAA